MDLPTRLIEADQQVVLALPATWYPSHGLVHVRSHDASCSILLAGAFGLRLAVDLAPNPERSCLGWNHFSGQTLPETLGWVQPLPASLATPADPVSPPLTWGPVFREADGRWIALAAVPSSWLDVRVQDAEETPDHVACTVCYAIGGGATLFETYRLYAARLTYQTWLQTAISGFRVNLPVDEPDTEPRPTVEHSGRRLVRRLGERSLTVEVEEADARWERSPVPFAAGDRLVRNYWVQGRAATCFTLQFVVQ